MPRIFGKEEFLQEFRAIAISRGGECLSDVYVNARKPLKWRCSKGHMWLATPDNIKHGKWCPECAKEKIQKAKIKYPIAECERYAREHGGKLLQADDNLRHNWVWQCSRGHTWNARPSQVMGLKTWCKRCKTLEARKDEIVADLQQRGIRMVTGDINNAKSRIQLECNAGHRWEASLASVFFARSGCPVCAGNIQLTLEEAQKIATNKGGRCLSTTYKNARTRLIWECRKGHRWKATLGSVKGGRRENGTWCPVCSNNSGSPKYTYDDAMALAKSRGGKFLSPEMKTVLDKYSWQCANGHIWQATFSSVYHNGSWCPSCSRHLGERLTRITFEALFNKKFPTARPDWLRSEHGTRLSLDGYCEELKLAFEHQGEQHYSDKNYFGNTPEQQQKIQSYDHRKHELCRKHGVELILIPEVPRLTPLDRLRECVIDACGTVGKAPPDLIKSVQYEQAYIEDGRLHRIHEVAEAHGGEVVEKTYYGMRHRYTWRCAKGHEWKQTADAIVNTSTWCPFCSGRHNITLGLLQTKAKEHDGEVLTPLYKNKSQRITCRCSRGHVFELVARSLISGSWCPKCRSQGTQKNNSNNGHNNNRATIGDRPRFCVTGFFAA